MTPHVWKLVSFELVGINLLTPELLECSIFIALNKHNTESFFLACYDGMK